MKTQKVKAQKVYDLFPHAVQFRFTEEEWKTYKEICYSKGESPHGNVRTFLKNYIKKNEKGL